MTSSSYSGNLGEMHRLSQRSHVNVHQAADRPLVVYEDHRFLVYVLWHALRVSKAFTEPPLLIFFDRHDDAKCPSQSALTELRGLRAGSPSEPEVLSCVEWSLSTLDDDWLLAAMELGVVADAICIGAERDDNLDGFLTTYSDGTGAQHRIWSIPLIWDALGYQGALSDTARRNELQDLWDALQWNPQPYPGGWPRCDGETKQGAPIVLDFDLDCFAGELAGHLTAWPSELLIARLSAPSECDTTKGWTAKSFLEQIDARVELRTVALESPYCGGLEASLQILSVLDYALWGESLRKSRFR